MAQIGLIPRAAMETMPWWKTLSPSEQRSVLLTTQSLSEEMERHGLSKLAIGRHLVKLREILEPKKRFCDYLRRNFPTCSVATAYRWIEHYESAREVLPEGFMRVAMSQGYHVIDAELVEKNPPPRTQDRAKITAYLMKLKDERKKSRAIRSEETVDQQALMRECFNFVLSRFERLPQNNKQQTLWLSTLFGTLLSELGVDGDQLVRPMAIPDGFRAVKGRPKSTLT
jgi:hypothetical protein